MKIRYLRGHFQHKPGDVIDNNMTVDQLNYLLRVGVVEMIEEEQYAEKAEKVHTKEKVENKTGNVPTAKMKAKKK